MDFIVQDALQHVEQPNTDSLLIGQAQIKVVGAGGAGNNAVSWLFRKGIRGAEIIAINTDAQHLEISDSDKKFLIGRELTRGLGCGGDPSRGFAAAKESLHQIKESLRGADMVYVVAGLGGGTGTGSASVIAQVAKESDAIVIGVVTMPFNIEKARIDKAEWGLKQLRNVCDTVIVIDNNRLVEIAGNLPITQAFAVANELISTMIKSIVEIIAVPSLINMDFADVKAIMKGGGVSVIGVGESDTKARVEEAVKQALSNPLLKVEYDGASGAMIHITGGEDLTLEEAERVGALVTKYLSDDANVMWGARIEKELRGRVRVLTIITGVRSPYVLGKMDYEKPSRQAVELNEELGIELANAW